MMSRWNRRETWLAIAAAAIACILWQFRLRFPFDDTFISFRYAEHLASGHGLVWNIGGAHTEGYTNVLFVLLLASAKLLSNDLLAAAQIIGLSATVISGVVIYMIGTQMRDWRTGIIATAMFLLAPLTWINALSGMETSLFVMLILLSLLFFGRGQLSMAFGVAFLATLTRPEGAMLGGILVLASWNGTNGSHGTYVRAALMYFALPLIAYASWKLWYFGSLLPNSFYVKVSDSPRLLPGLQYVRLFATSILALIFASLGTRHWRTHPVMVSATLWSAILIVFYLFVNPLEGLYDRFLWPAFTTLCVIAAVGLHDFSERLQQRMLPWAILALQVILMLRSPRTTQSLSANEAVWDASMDGIVTELKLLPHFESLTLAYGDAGYVVYKSGVRHLDLFGLNDTRIARAPTREERVTILRSERPDLMLLPVLDTAGRTILVEDAFGVANDTSFRPVASIAVFPYKLVLLLNTQSTAAYDLSETIVARLKSSGTALLPPPTLYHSTE